MSVALLLALLVAGANAACIEVAAAQATVGAMNLLDGSVPWLCVPPQGELKLAKLDLSLSSDGVLPFQGQYREKKDVEPTIAIVCDVPLSFASMLLAGGKDLKVDITNLTVTCVGPKPESKVYFAMKNRILVGPPPECKKVQITDAGNGTYAAVDYTGTAGPACGVTEAPATVAGTTNANGQIAATGGAAQNGLATPLLLGLVFVVGVAKW